MNHKELQRNPTSEWINALRLRYPMERTMDDTLTRKLRRRAAPSPAGGEDFPAQVQNFLAKRIDGPFTMKNLRPLTGGASKEQFVFDLDWTCNGEQRTAERLSLIHI